MDVLPKVPPALIAEVKPDLFPMYPVKQDAPLISDEDRRAHRKARTPLWRYLLHARPLAVLTAPIIYLCFVAFLFLDAVITLYQAICFPVYGVPKVRRADYLIFDRGALVYLNVLERLNCIYCSYANGLIAYVMEVVGRTEQHWCPLKHARKAAAQHSRYSHFLPYGDAAEYRKKLDTVRDDFGDLRS
ncbi:hypothetical protein Terro_2546 [Terriglobus roseus DSM 18391]|uniref:Uncharacterized protein n=1 Tax=Terriglobus roseus (strain DSM 18391 / NRRL B-41598 / KBS 63) TaxID=926566 RepID=I3ZGT1_TERRK|nr:hypothetical protein [Terriglobus roseus]AFL88449.1 hypothetical protein Terro_2182 [Terriglobus roseus DSM 18391]AFL88791.1 hypothetical protein Terro_2546 [Terriglobus roseus DSM 18391]